MFFKRLFCLLLSLISVLLSSCSHGDRADTEEEAPQADEMQAEFVGVWLSCYELADMLADGSEEKYRLAVKEVAENCVAKGINAIFLQVRAFADSIYPSEIFPFSKYIQSSGELPEFDVLELFIQTAHSYSVEVHAWINPYRISYSNDIDSPDVSVIARNDEYKSGIICIDEGIYFDPCVVKNQSLVLRGVREILDNYDVDGIHIDDYFYPLTDVEFDKQHYESYRDTGGRLSFSDWRRENVNCLVSSLYSLVHSYGDELIFSISPSGDIKRNYSSYYADVELWLKTQGYADMIIPQLYYGFEHEKMPFEKIARMWEKADRADGVRLVCGLAAYKQGAKDSLAGDGSDEWISNRDVIERQIACLDSSDFNGYALFSYKSIL